MFHISMGMTGGAWSERKVGEAVFTERGWSKTKEVKMAANVAFLRWGMRGYKSKLLRSALQLPNMSVSDNE